MSLTAVTHEEHANKRWLGRDSFSFAAGDSVTPLVAEELAIAAHSLPMAFIKHADNYTLVAVMGLVSGENLMVTLDGKWSGDYLPLNYRTGPFRLASDSEGKSVLCVDPSTGLISEGSEGHLFFEEDGQPTETIKNMLDMLSRMKAGQNIVATACSTLEKLGLFEIWPVEIESGRMVEGLFKVNESAFNSLGDEDFLLLRKTNALAVTYSHWISMINLPSMIQKLQQRESDRSKANPEVISETFSFANL